MQIEESFKSIPGYPKYVISNFGRVINVQTDHVSTITRNKSNGWYVVGLTDGRKQTVKSVARLVAEMFLDPPEEPRMSVLHKDGDRSNNRVDNLKWEARWFVVVYMKQLQDPVVLRVKPFRSVTTGETFQTIAEFSAKTGVLPGTVWTALSEANETYFPVHGLLKYC